MAVLKLNRARLQHNFRFLSHLFEEKNIEWGVVTKILCGTKIFIEELIQMGVMEMHDTRISNLKIIKSIAPHIQTVYIKPPARSNVRDVIQYADVSFNSSFGTIELLSEEAVRQQKEHRVIIMIEMGDLREGVLGKDLLDFYSRVCSLPNITIAGLGTNFNCLNGIMPSKEKLVRLCAYKKELENMFKHDIPWVSGGTSVALSLLLSGDIPKEVNHFRLGEALFFANDLFTGKTFKGMLPDVFSFEAEIIELKEKPMIPDGEQQANVAGYIPEYNPLDADRTSNRAILDVGLLDINPSYLTPIDSNIVVIEASSDMLVLDLGTNENGYKIGDFIAFKIPYMGALGLLHSFYIQKQIV